MDIWNSDTARQIRKSVHEGTFSYCDREYCPFIQCNALQDKDQVTDHYFRNIIDKELTVLPNGPRKLLLGNDLTCNLWCPACRAEKFVLTGRDFDEAYIMQEKLCEEVLKGVRLLHLAGGETFASRLHMHLLTSINCSQYPDMKILIQTNGLLLTPATWDRIRGIRDAIKYIYISIDAVYPETYRFLRRGGNFKQLLKNIEFVSKLRKESLKGWTFHL